MASTYGSVSTVKYERKDIVDPLMALVVFSLLGRLHVMDSRPKLHGSQT